MDGLHRVTGTCSACFSFFVLMMGFSFHRQRFVLYVCIPGFVCLALSCVSGAGCSSGLLAWLEGKVSVTDLPQGTLLNASLSPIGSLCLIFGHLQNLKWVPRRQKQHKAVDMNSGRVGHQIQFPFANSLNRYRYQFEFPQKAFQFWIVLPISFVVRQARSVIRTV